MATAEPTTELKASCMCGQLSASCNVPNKDFPVEYTICHCWTCRHMTGLLALTLLNVHRPLTVKGTPVQYTYPGGPKTFSRYFCGHCGTSVYEDGEPPTRYASLCSGALEKLDGLANIKSHIYVSDTGDGGLSVWLPQLPAFEEKTGGAPYTGPFVGQELARHAADERLDCTCRCGGVQFYITRPNEESRDLHSDFSNSLAPLDGGEDRHKNAGDVKWWISADGKRYAACNCACYSCRKFSGYDLQQWAFVPLVNILQKDGRPMDFSMGKLKEYSSSEGVIRHFCGGCGATVFFRSMKRPKLIDVSVGLMDASSGSRAEEWLKWQLDRVSYIEDAHHTKLVGMLHEGLKEYQKKKAQGA